MLFNFPVILLLISVFSVSAIHIEVLDSETLAAMRGKHYFFCSCSHSGEFQYCTLDSDQLTRDFRGSQDPGLLRKHPN